MDKNRMLALLPLVLLLAFVPLIVYLKVYDTPFGSMAYFAWPLGEKNYDFFSYYKALLINLSALLMLVVLFIRKAVKSSYIYIFMGGYLLFVILSTVFSPFGEVALVGVSDRFEGFTVLFSYVIICFFSINILNDKTDFKIAIGALYFSTFFAGLVGIFQYFGYDLFKSRFGKLFILPKAYEGLVDSLNFTFGKYTIYGTMYNTNFVGSYMVMLLFFSLLTYFFVKKRWQVILSCGFYLLVFANWIGCRSRAGVLAGQVTILLFILFFWKKLLEHKRKTISILGLSLLMVFCMNSVSKNTLGTKLYNMALGDRVELRGVSEGDGTLVIEALDKKLVISYPDGELVFRDGIGNLVPVEKDGRNRVLGGDFEGYTFTRNKKYEDLWLFRHKNINYEFVVKDGGFKTLNSSDRVEDIASPSRIRAFDEIIRKGSKRVYIWSRSIPILKECLLLGFGPDTYSIVFPQEDYFGKLLAFKTKSIIVDKPHNQYLQIGINTGIPSLVFFLLMAASYFFQSIAIYWNRNFDDFYEVFGLASFLSVTAYLAAAMFNDSLVSVAPVFWFILGMGVAINLRLKSQSGNKASF